MSLPRFDATTKKSGGLLFMKGGETIGEKKRGIHRPHGAMHIHIYIHAIVVNCQRYYGLCPVRTESSSSLPFSAPSCAPSQFFPHSSPLSKRWTLCLSYKKKDICCAKLLRIEHFSPNRWISIQRLELTRLELLQYCRINRKGGCWK